MNIQNHARVSAVGVAFAAGMLWLGASSRAADIAEPVEPPTLPETVGVVCTLNDPFARADMAATLPWPSVWLGHFSGGRPYRDEFGRILIDWHDEKVCFASQAICRAWIGAMRQGYHDPEGYWTCMLLR